jgi:proteasome lid subunit RPN8/RPN11
MSPKLVKIKQNVVRDLKRLAKKSNIICGILAGKRVSEIIEVKKIYAMKTKPGPTIHFKPDFMEFRKIMKEIERKEMIVGEFHTHPKGPCELTQGDKRIIKRIPPMLWLIATPNEVKAWFVDKELVSAFQTYGLNIPVSMKYKDKSKEIPIKIIK